MMKLTEYGEKVLEIVRRNTLIPQYYDELLGIISIPDSEIRPNHMTEIMCVIKDIRNELNEEWKIIYNECGDESEWIVCCEDY